MGRLPWRHNVTTETSQFEKMIRLQQCTANANHAHIAESTDNANNAHIRPIDPKTNETL